MKNSACRELCDSARLYIGMIYAIVPNGLKGVVPKLRSASFRTVSSRAWKTVMVMSACALFSSNAHGHWNQFQLAPPRSSAFLGKIAAVSRIPNSMEVWWIAQDGSVQDAYWYEGGQWNQFTLALPGSAAYQGAGIAAVSRIPNSMEVRWTGANGSVQDANWYAAANEVNPFSVRSENNLAGNAVGHSFSVSYQNQRANMRAGRTGTHSGLSCQTTIVAKNRTDETRKRQ
jgi:hypothetical protein